MEITLFSVHIVAQLEKSSQINGVVVIMDFDGLGMKQVKALSPASQKRLLTFIQDAMPMRLKEVHFVKQPFIFNMVWQLFKPFVKEKLKNRVRRLEGELNSFERNLSSIFRCGSMATTWRSCTNIFRPRFCRRTTVELCPKSITPAKTGTHVWRSTLNSTEIGTHMASNKLSNRLSNKKKLFARVFKIES